MTDFVQNFSKILLCVKMILIPGTVIYFVVDTIYELYLKKREDEIKIAKILKIINDVLFYIIIGLLVVICLFLLIVFRNKSVHLINHTMKNLGFHKEHLINQKKKKLTLSLELNNYYESLAWWMILYLFIITICALIAKIIHDPRFLYNLF